MFRPKIGLALGGGGPKGLAHIGVIKVLVDHGIPIHCIAGTSAGALIGGMYAFSGDIRTVESYILEKNRLEMLSYIVDPSFRGGFLEGNRLEQFLKGFLHEATFQQLRLPFAATAVDLKTGKKVDIVSGVVSTAIRASCTIPMLFKPVEIGNHLFVDGGVLSSVPVQTAFDMGADIVIAVQLNKVYKPEMDMKKLNIVEVGELAFNILERKIANEEIRKAQVILQPHAEHIHWSALMKHDEKTNGIRRGEEEAILHLPHMVYHSKRRSIEYAWNRFVRSVKKMINPD